MNIIPNHDVVKKLDICVAACNCCASACLKEDDVKMMAQCISLDIDCAEVCRTTSILLARDSIHGKHILKECIEICEACADECAKHKHDHCKACAEACRECAEACKAMA